MDDPQLLPPGTRLVHIGPQKTGTTYLQAAVHAARGSLARQGIFYASPNRQAKQAARAVIGLPAPSAGGKVPRRTRWTRVVASIHRSKAARVLLSAEALAEADEKAIQRIVRDLEPERIHVVATLRPLARILPSQWQQYVQGGLALPYESWLRSILDPKQRDATPSFWRRHRHDLLLARWASVVGADRVTAVIIDERDPQAVLRAFEALLGAHPGTLRAMDRNANRSLTRSEIELVQAMQRVYAKLGLSRALRVSLVLQGAAPSMESREPAEDEPRIETPSWAEKRLVEVTTEIVDGLAASGVRVTGDLESLRSVRTRHRRVSVAAAQRAWPSVGGAALMGVLTQTGLTRGQARANMNFELWSTPRLVGLLFGRARAGVPAPLRRPAGRVWSVLRRGRPRRARARRSSP